MRVFVTGGTGLIGRHLLPLLVERGDQVLCLSRDPAAARRGLPDSISLIGGDPSLPGDWQDRLATCDGVVNLAGASVGEGRWTRSRLARIRRSRLATTENVAAALAAGTGAKVLVSASAVGYYGNRGSEALSETSPPGAGFLSRLSVEWEHTARQAEREGVRVVLLRTGVVLAREGGALPRMLLPFRLGLGGPLGGGRQYVPWIHRHDVARAILFALDSPGLRGPVNAVVADPPQQREFAAALGRALGKPAFLPTPGFVLRLVLGRQSELVLASQRAVPNVLKAKGFKFVYGELDAALAELLRG